MYQDIQDQCAEWAYRIDAANTRDFHCIPEPEDQWLREHIEDLRLGGYSTALYE